MFRFLAVVIYDFAISVSDFVSVTLRRFRSPPVNGLSSFIVAPYSFSESDRLGREEREAFHASACRPSGARVQLWR